MELFERIKHLRKKEKLTQETFARILGIHRGHISKIETGKAAPSNQLLKSICYVFEINEEWLREGKGPIEKEGRNETFNKLKEEMEFIHYNSFLMRFKLASETIKSMRTALSEQNESIPPGEYTPIERHPLFDAIEDEYKNMKNEADFLIDTASLIVYNKKSK